jgi:hypothetical protein
MPSKSSGTRTTFDHDMPTINTGTSTAKPAIGPATPMSNSAARVGKPSRMRMTAPNVPASVGAGMK